MRSEHELRILQGLRRKEIGEENYSLIGGEYVLTPDGFGQINQYTNNDTKLAQYLRNKDVENQGEQRRAEAEERMVPVARGFAKLLASMYSVPVAGLELMGAIDEGSVEEFGQAFEQMLKTELPEQEGIGPMLAETATQYVIPGVGYYKLFSVLTTKMKGFNKFIAAAFSSETKQKLAKVGMRLFGAEFATTMTAQTPTDQNFTSFLVDVMGLDEETSVLMQNEIINSIATPADDWDAIAVFREKFEAVPGDLLVAGTMEAIIPLAVGIIKSFRNIKRNGDNIVDIVDDEGLLSETKINKVASEFSEDIYKPITLEQESVILPGLMKAIIDGKKEGGFTITLDGKLPIDLGYENGYMVAPLKETELKFPAKDIDLRMLKEFMQNVDKLRVTAEGRYREVYAGGWIDDEGMYVLDASVRVDNLDDALYIARAGNQDAVFDLKEFKDIGTKEGIAQLKRDKVYQPTRQLDRIRETKDVRRGFKKARMERNGQGQLAGGTT